MPKPMPSWMARDLETAIIHQMNVTSELGPVASDPNIPNHIRVSVVEALTEAKLALSFLREIRSAHEQWLEENGQGKARA